VSDSGYHADVYDIDGNVVNQNIVSSTGAIIFDSIGKDILKW
jgi:hypothetical protein